MSLSIFPFFIQTQTGSQLATLRDSPPLLLSVSGGRGVAQKHGVWRFGRGNHEETRQLERVGEALEAQERAAASRLTPLDRYIVVVANE